MPWMSQAAVLLSAYYSLRTVDEPGQGQADEDVEDVGSDAARHRHVALAVARHDDGGEEVGHRGACRWKVTTTR
eukprot:scaffold73652_cov45-Phaeocystis_antarctica.AAC.2